jgi:hypothetical protein
MQVPDHLEKSHYLGAALVVLVLGGVAAYTSLSMDPSEQEPEVVLVVFDGADWKPINDMREEDRLPHMSRMMEEGVYGDLMTPKAFSPVTWTKIGTGQQASDLNIDGWTVENGDGSRRSIKSTDVKHRRFWDYMNEKNVSTGVVSYLLTWPVEDVNGFMVSGPLTTSTTRNMYPGDAFNKSIVDGGNEWEIADMVLESERAEEVEFLALGFKRLDAYQHSLWKFLVPEKFGMERTEQTDKYAEVVYAEYERMDEVLGRFDEDTNVILVSDSGFTAEGGYQATSLEQFLDGNAPSGFVYPTYEANLNPLLEEMGYAEHQPTRQVLGEEIREIDASRSDLQWCSIDYPYPTYLNKTTYFVRFCIHDDSLDVNETMDRLEQVRYRDGRKFFTELRYDPEYNSIRGKHKIYQDGIVREEVVEAYSHQPTFHGEKYEVEVELGLQLPDGEPYNLSVGPEKTGDHPHMEHGIFMAAGPDIADKGELEEESFRSVDVTPTLLYMYGIPIPRGMEGEPLTGLFTEEFNEEREVTYTNGTTLRESYLEDVNRTDLEDEAVKNRLRELGYLN